jgi:hypothetical protein
LIARAWKPNPTLDPEAPVTEAASTTARTVLTRMTAADATTPGRTGIVVFIV